MKLKFKGIYVFWILIIIVCLMISTIVVMWIGLNKISKKRTVAQYMAMNTDWKRKDKVEETYTARMYDIIDLFSSKYQSKSMSKSERIKYTHVNFKLANKFGYSPYVIPILHLLESDFNPHKDHEPYKEVGMGGFWYSTARRYYNIAKNDMPRDLWHAVKFDLRNRDSLKNPENALKMSYIWIWIELRNYKGNWMCAIAAYRWGRFLAQFAIRGIIDDFPVRFKIKTSFFGWKTYDCRAYHWTWNHLKTAFENGDLAIARDIHSDWKRKEDKRIVAEIDYRTGVKHIKRLIKRAESIEEVKAILKIEEDKYLIELKRAKRDLKRIGRVANKEGWHTKVYKAFRNKAKEIYKGVFEEKK